MKTLKEWAEEASREAIVCRLLELNDMWLSFEEFLRRELGPSTFYDLVNQWSAESVKTELVNLGMSEKEIDNFNDSMRYHKKKDPEA